MQKGEFFVTGEVFLLYIGLLMGAIKFKSPSDVVHLKLRNVGLIRPAFWMMRFMVVVN